VISIFICTLGLVLFVPYPVLVTRTLRVGSGSKFFFSSDIQSGVRSSLNAKTDLRLKLRTKQNY